MRSLVTVVGALGLLALVLVWTFVPYYTGAEVGSDQAHILLVEGELFAEDQATPGVMAVTTKSPSECGAAKGTARLLGRLDRRTGTFENRDQQLACSSVRLLSALDLKEGLAGNGAVQRAELPSSPNAGRDGVRLFHSSRGTGYLTFDDVSVRTVLEDEGNRWGRHSIVIYRYEGQAMTIEDSVFLSFAHERWSDF